MATERDGGLAATVILPTSGDRSPVLDYSIPSVLGQTVSDLELIVIGDGIEEPARQLVQRYAAEDPRVTLVDRPKHPSRGEPYRHEALQTARGRIVCYLCDRDLMLPDHVETMSRLLERADFAHTARIMITKRDRIIVREPLDLSHSADRRRVQDAVVPDDRLRPNGVPLSLAAHTLEMYHRLTWGWQRTPEGFYTDNFMWSQFLADPRCRAVSENLHVTILYFPRRPKAEWPSARRADELARWKARTERPDWPAPFEEELRQARIDGWIESARHAYRWRRRRRLPRLYFHYYKFWFRDYLRRWRNGGRL